MPKNHDLLIAASTIWVVVTAVLVMFMQAGFAFLEAGLTRMKNAGHIAGKNVLIFGDLLARLLGGRLRARVRRRQRAHRHRTASSRRSTTLTAVGQKPFDWFSRDPGRGRLPVRGRLRRRLARDRLGRDGRAREALGLLRLRRLLHAHLLDRRRTGSGARTAGCSSTGMQDFAGSTVVHYQGALAGARRGAAPRAAHRQVRHRRPREPDPGPQHPVRRARDAHPLVRLVRLQPGLDALGRLRRLRLLRLRRADDEHRRRRGRARRHRASPGSCSASRTSR